MDVASPLCRSRRHRITSLDAQICLPIRRLSHAADKVRYDYSGMIERWTGKNHVAFIESLIVSDINALAVNNAALSLFTNTNGGIIDDTIITKLPSSLHVVTNAGCALKDLAHINSHLDLFNQRERLLGGCESVKVDVVDRSLVALQGPLARMVLAKISSEPLDSLLFMQTREVELGGFKVHLSRGGYTGEDGFEISVDHADVEQLCELLLTFKEVRNAGLGARDTLRLEAGMCLYGHDLDKSITPVEAGLGWTIGEQRRKFGGFLGDDVILPQLKNGVHKKRVGFSVEGAPAREGAEIFSKDLMIVVTSGGPSPSLKLNIGMGYIQTGYHKPGTAIQVKVRNRLQPATIIKMPFLPSHYHR